RRRWSAWRIYVERFSPWRVESSASSTGRARSKFREPQREWSASRARNAAGGRTRQRTSPRVQSDDDLLDVLVHELGHLEHRDLALSTKHRLQLVVGVDHAAFLRILKVVPLDVRPELLRDLGTRQRIVADDRTERRIRLLRRHERGVGFALRAALLRGLLRA